jgi:hypothetical protein
MQEANLVAILLACFTLVGTLGGFWVSNHFELKREESRDVRDRDRQWRERQLTTIDALQTASIEALHGLWTGKAVSEKAMAEADLAKLKGEFPSYPDLTEEQWHQNWTSAIRQVVVMASRLQDAELQQLVGEANMMQARTQKIDNLEEFDKEFKLLEAKVAEVNERAGALYREFDAPAMQAKPRERWFCQSRGLNPETGRERWTCNPLF